MAGMNSWELLTASDKWSSNVVEEISTPSVWILYHILETACFETEFFIFKSTAWKWVKTPFVFVQKLQSILGSDFKDYL